MSIDSADLAWREVGILRAQLKKTEARLDHYERAYAQVAKKYERLTDRLRRLYADFPEVQSPRQQSPTKFKDAEPQR